MEMSDTPHTPPEDAAGPEAPDAPEAPEAPPVPSPPPTTERDVFLGEEEPEGGLLLEDTDNAQP